MYMANERKDKATIHFEANEQLTSYLHKVIDAGGYGNNPTSVVQSMSWEVVRKLVETGWIEKNEEE